MPHVEQLEHLTVPVSPSSFVTLRNLPPSGDTGFHRKELVTSITELVGFLQRHRSGTDNRELARKHVDELG